MSPPKFHGSKMEKDPIDFIDEAYRIVAVMEVPWEEKTELIAYQLKGVVKIRY